MEFHLHPDFEYVDPELDCETTDDSAIQSKYVEGFNPTPGDKLFLSLRVSGDERKSNLVDSRLHLTDAVQGTGADIVGYYAKCISGQDIYDPGWMREVIRRARLTGANIILAETVDRFVRHPEFNAKSAPNLQATDEQLGELVRLADGIRLMTHLHPDASPSEVRSYQRKRGQRFKSKGGRPKIQTRKEKVDLILHLYRCGWKIREIAKNPMVSVPKSTVADWIRKYA